MVGAVFAYLLWRRRVPWTWTLAVVLAFALAAAPYAIYLLQYGSPTPETPAQIALLTDGARAAGWADLPRKSFPDYLAISSWRFVADWMPTLGARSDFNYAMLVIPVAALACALAGIALSLRRLWRRRETALDIVVIAGAFALAATFAIHVTYSYGRHLATGWLMDAYPRYYLPLAAIVPLAGLSLACRDRDAALARRDCSHSSSPARSCSAFSARRSADPSTFTRLAKVAETTRPNLRDAAGVPSRAFNTCACTNLPDKRDNAPWARFASSALPSACSPPSFSACNGC